MTARTLPSVLSPVTPQWQLTPSRHDQPTGLSSQILNWPGTFPMMTLLSGRYVRRSALLWLAIGLLSGSVLGQSSGANPAVTSANLRPAPLEKVGSVFSLSFLIGNVGVGAPITGVGDGERMGFYIDLKQCLPNPANEKALSGSALSLFDVTYNADSNRIEGRQKVGAVLDVLTLHPLMISAVVTQASPSPDDNSIGARCRILPNTNALPAELLDDDVISIYTHTAVNTLVDAQVSFSAQDQSDRTVLLKWSTSAERAVKTFILERSKDSKRFETVEQVTDLGKSNNPKRQYQFVDKSPYRGTSYYRLRLVEPDGTEHTYPARLPVILDGQYGVSTTLVVGQSFTLNLDEPQTAVLHLYTAGGKELALNKSEATESSLKLSATDKLDHGLYLLLVEERGTTRQYQLVVR